MKVIKFILIQVSLLGLLLSTPIRADFDPELLSKSTVRILVKYKGRIISAATGFVWKNNNHIVTSLHVMSDRPRTKIIVEFERKKRLATIISVLPNADLVLLEVKKPIAGWLPLSVYKKDKPKFKDEVSALGFNKGSSGMSTRALTKGFIKPEVLAMLLPPDALNKLKKSKVLDLKLPIYYLDGSLLPGYSGSPIVDTNGVLIGIGDGGLENGASGVSWVIPALHLDHLDKATVAQLPLSLETTRQAFSADTESGPLENAIANSDEIKSNLNTLYQMLFNTLVTANKLIFPQANAEEGDYDEALQLDEYKEVIYDRFTFVKTKSRSYQQMLASTSDPEGFKKVFEIYQHLFDGYRVGYEDFVFDIYEDGGMGLNITVPSGVNLTVDKDNYLLLEGDMFCRTCPYEIQYFVRNIEKHEQATIKKSPATFLNRMADEHWKELNEEGDYNEYSEFRGTQDFGNNRHILRAAFSDLHADYQHDFELNYYTAATNQKIWFQVQGILNKFDRRFFKKRDKYRGTDCRAATLSKGQIDTCHGIETMLKVLMAVHLTSFSNTLFYEQVSKNLIDQYE